MRSENPMHVLGASRSCAPRHEIAEAIAMHAPKAWALKSATLDGPWAHRLPGLSSAFPCPIPVSNRRYPRLSNDRVVQSHLEA